VAPATDVVKHATGSVPEARDGVAGTATHAIQDATTGITGTPVQAIENATDGITGTAVQTIQNATTGITGTATHAIQDATMGLGGTLQNVVDQTNGAVRHVVGQVPRHLLPPALGTQVPTTPETPSAPSGPSAPSATFDPPAALNGWQGRGPISSNPAGGHLPSATSSIGSHGRSVPSGGIRGGSRLHLASLPQALSNYGAAASGANADAQGPLNGSRSPSLPGPAAQSGSGSSIAAGIALALAALLVALMAVRPPRSLRRLAIAPATLRPAPELGSLDRPG
jgi:hypothetical protein